MTAGVVLVASRIDKWAHALIVGLERLEVEVHPLMIDDHGSFGYATGSTGSAIFLDSDSLDPRAYPFIWRKPRITHPPLDDSQREILTSLHLLALENARSLDLPQELPKISWRVTRPWIPAPRWWAIYRAPANVWEQMTSSSGRFVAKRMTPVCGVPPRTVEVQLSELDRNEPWLIEELIETDTEYTISVMPDRSQQWFAADRDPKEVDIRVSWGNFRTKWREFEPADWMVSVIDGAIPISEHDFTYRVDAVAKSSDELAVLDINRGGELAWVTGEMGLPSIFEAIAARVRSGA